MLGVSEPSVHCLTFAPALTAACRRSCGVIDGNRSSDFLFTCTTSSNTRVRQFDCATPAEHVGDTLADLGSFQRLARQLVCQRG